MKTKFSFLFFILFSLVLTVQADLPFRNHRYDGFKILPVNRNSIVFIGNSITNMHNWDEAFSNGNVLNRGVSGCVSQETLDNIESILVGKPAQVYLMIGTNDLGTQGLINPQYVAGNVRKIITRIQKESPETKIYIESILPSTSGLRTLADEEATNKLYEELCKEMGVTYVDLYSKLKGILSPGSTNTSLSIDGLHLNMAGYRIWCNQIAEYVGSDCVYRATANNQFARLAAAYDMRLTCFGEYRINEGDALFIGDEMLHGTELHNLLSCDKVKDRGTAWGYPGPPLSAVLSEIPIIFNNRPDGGLPAKVFIYAGVSDVNQSTALSDIMTTYRKVVTSVRAKAPDAQIYIMGLNPRSNASQNSSRVQPFNKLLKEYADESATDKIDYIDTYTPFVSTSNTANTKMFSGDYIWGRGYAKLSQILAPYLAEEGAKAISDEEAEAAYAMFNVRTSLGNMLSNLEEVKAGDGVGQYPASALTELKQKMDAAYAAMAADGVTVEELQAQQESLQATYDALLPAINTSFMDEQSETKWFTFCSSLRGNYYMKASNATAGVVGSTINTGTSTHWAFVKRTDGKGYDIVNRKYGTYLNPVVAYNTQLKTTSSVPSRGWTVSYAATVGLYIVSSGTSELNQTNLSNFPLYNWSSGRDGTDRKDLGCQFLISEAPQLATSVKLSDKKTSYWYSMKSSLRDNRFVSATGGAAGLVGEAEMTNASQWKFVERSDDNGWDIVNREYNCYISPSAANDSQLKTAAKSPEAGWLVLPAETEGLFIVVSGEAQFNQTVSDLGYKIYNWGGGANTSDAGCQFLFNLEETADHSTDEDKPVEVVLPAVAFETTKVLTFDGTEPYRIPDEQAAKIKGDQLTIYVDLTEASASSANHALVASCDEKGTEFFSLFGAAKYGVRYTSNTTGAADQFTLGGAASTNRSQLVLTIDNSTRHYVLYQDGVQVRDFSHALLGEGAQWEYRTLGNVKGQTGMYLGGVSLGTGNILLFRGTLHDVRIWAEVLTAEQIASIPYRDHSTTGLSLELTEKQQPADVYDLQGRKVNSVGRGFYIVGGKKIVR